MSWWDNPLNYVTGGLSTVAQSVANKGGHIIQGNSSGGKASAPTPPTLPPPPTLPTSPLATGALQKRTGGLGGNSSIGGAALAPGGNATVATGNSNTTSDALYQGFQDAYGQAGKMGQQNLQDIQQGGAAAQQHAQYQQDLMSRKAAAMSAIMGGSAGGGAAQAGATQAALSGEQLQNQATQDTVRQMVGARSAMIQNQMSIAQQMLSSATSSDQYNKASAMYLQTQNQANMIQILDSMVQSGHLTDPSQVMAAFDNLQSNLGTANSFPVG